VFGLVRRSSTEKLERIAHLTERVELLRGDLLDPSSLIAAVRVAQPHEVYNLAAQSFVPTSWQEPVLTAEFTGLGVTRLLEGVRAHAPQARFYQASSSEIFGATPHSPQREDTPFWPRSPYGVAKLYAHWITVNYRESYGMFTCCGLLFNHESPRRGTEFVTRKISQAAARIKLGQARELVLGNLDARRDWGFAGDYVRAMWAMLQQERPRDYVIATGESHSVREFCELAFGTLELDWRDWVRVDPRLARPAEIECLVGDASRARAELGWRPTVPFSELVRSMVVSDLNLAQARGSSRPT
jgi:GDPmannose 4,6-dehydratase